MTQCGEWRQAGTRHPSCHAPHSYWQTPTGTSSSCPAAPFADDAVCGRPSRRRPRQIRPGQLTPCAARRPPPPVGASPARTFPPRQGTTGTGALPFRRNQTGPRGPSVSGRPARWPDIYYFYLNFPWKTEPREVRRAGVREEKGEAEEEISATPACWNVT